MTTPRPSGRAWPLLVTTVAALILCLLWNMPFGRDGSGWTTAPVALEVVVLVGLLAWSPRLRSGRGGVFAAGTAAVLTTLIVVLNVADLAIRDVLARPLNPFLDVQLLAPVTNLLTGMFGTVLGWLASVALAVAPFLIGVLVYVLLRRAQRGLEDRIVRRVTLAGCAAFLAWFAVGQPLLGGVWNDERRLVDVHATQVVAGYVRAARETVRGIAEITAAMAHDRFDAVPATALLDRLGGADVVLVFFESYGRSAIEMPRYAKATAATLEAFDHRLTGRGLVSASAWLTSPTVGGQSWLANGTFTSGLWLPDQGRYDTAMRSPRLTFARAFARAGYRTVAIKPAVTLPWPDGATQGFARIYAAYDLGYAGLSYNWVEMPDQYTLSAFQRAEPRRASQPLFAEVSLISSHSPWTPIPPVLNDWDSIGDGRVFSQWAESGYTPEEVWRDEELTQKQYGLSIEYVLKVLSGYAERYVDSQTLLIIVGDHQPPVFVTGDGAGAQVPIHIISGDPRLVAPFMAAGFTPGMRPAPGLAPRRMDWFRDFFFEVFSAGATPTIDRSR